MTIHRCNKCHDVMIVQPHKGHKVNDLKYRANCPTCRNWYDTDRFDYNLGAVIHRNVAQLLVS